MKGLVFAPARGPLTPHELWTAWNANPFVVIPLAISVCIYLGGTLHLWRRAGTGHGITMWRGASFLSAMLALVLALLSPLDALSDALFSAHMVQHWILILLASPLLVVSDFPLALLWTLPRGWAQRLGQGLNQSRTLSHAWQVISNPISAWLLFAILLWVWHTSTLYETALRNDTIHTLEHLGFLATAMLFWWVLLKPKGQKHLRYGMAIPYLFTTFLQSGILGALMTFSSEPWYPYYKALVIPWGLTPLEDQQLAGLIMWIPGGLIFTVLTIGYFAAWLHALEERSVRRNTNLLERIKS